MQLLVDHRGMERYLFHVLAKEESAAFAGGHLPVLALSLRLIRSCAGTLRRRSGRSWPHPCWQCWIAWIHIGRQRRRLNLLLLSRLLLALCTRLPLCPRNRCQSQHQAETNPYERSIAKVHSI